ncbi:MAG TPA: amino acid adenylation domain-containing protein [Longimicrobium sp.]|nr:amino acid adenylation domain-containing protein [Longimicrobium sp.]
MTTRTARGGPAAPAGAPETGQEADALAPGGIAPHRVAACSFAQERLWLVQQVEGGSEAYHLFRAFHVHGPLDAAALERALGEVVRRHETLRTTFREVDGLPVQVIAPPGAFALPIAALPPLDEAEREARVERLAAEEAARPFDLEAGPLFRATLLRLGGEAHVLLLCMHHVVGDGWSLGLLYRELSALYDAYRDGRASPLAEPPLQYADYARWNRKRLGGPLLERQLAWWTERLAGAPALLELPTDRPRGAARSRESGNVSAPLPVELLERLQAVGRGEGATRFMVLLAAFQALLSRYGGGADVVVGAAVAGRMRSEVEGLIGFFANTLALRTDLSGDPAFRELLRRVREATLGAYEHQELPFERLVAELAPERSLSHTPVFQVTISVDGERPSELAFAGASVAPLEVVQPVSRFDLSLFVVQSAGAWRAAAYYRTDLFDRATLERMLGHLERVLEQVAADPDVRLSALELPGRAERRLVLDEWNPTAGEHPERSIAHWFEGQAARTPDADALVFEDGSLTYRELNQRANRLARHLARRGVGLEARVGVCLERSPALVVSLLAVLKAGGAYVPLDPGYPAERLAFILADAGVAVLVTEERMRAALPPVPDLPVVSVDGAAAEIAAEGADDVESGAGPRSLAYVIYTSGSTGTPRGVGVEHRGVVRLVRSASYVDLGPGETVLQAAPVSFDASTFELWGALLNGGRLVLVAGATPSLEALGRAIARHGVTTMWLTAGLFQVMVQERLEDLAGVRQLVAGGDVLPVEQVLRVRRRFPGLRLINGYGPTENTTFTCCHTLPAGWSGGSVPIGSPISGTRVYVLDAWLRPVPIGVPGELCAGGDGVARGYLNRPAQTAARFVPDPFGPGPGARMYRTGDRVRWRADGTVEYLGRMDEQVKVRGFRVEPGEVETVLRRHPGVADCVVVAHADEEGGRRLVAYVAGGADADALRAHLGRSLPGYMVPGAFVALDHLPLTPNGKVDRRALPEPVHAAAEARYLAPRTPVEATLAAICAEVLRLDRVGVDESFFALGGHSLLATRVISRVRAAFGVELPVRALFEDPTVAALARLLADAPAPVAADAGAGEGVGADSSPHRLLTVLDDLSEEALDRLLAGHSRRTGSSE